VRKPVFPVMSVRPRSTSLNRGGENLTNGDDAPVTINLGDAANAILIGHLSRMPDIAVGNGGAIRMGDFRYPTERVTAVGVAGSGADFRHAAPRVGGRPTRISIGLELDSPIRVVAGVLDVPGVGALPVCGSDAAHSSIAVKEGPDNTLVETTAGAVRTTTQCW